MTNTFTFFHIKKSVNKGKYSQSWASQVVIVAKNSPDNAGDTGEVGSWVDHLVEDSLDVEMAPHSSSHAWKTSGTEGPEGLQSMKSQRVRHD